MGREMIVNYILTTIGASICARTGGRQVIAVPSSLTSSSVQGWPPTVTE